MGLKKQRFGSTMHFPEGLENTPFNPNNENFNNFKRMVLPSGAQAILMFSPLVEMVAAAFDDLDSQIRTCFKKRKNNGFILLL